MTNTDAIEAYRKRKNIDDNEDMQYLNLIAAVGSVEYTGDVDSLSLKEVKYFDGGIPQTHYASVVGLGFGNVAASFAKAFESRIKLNAKATEINYSSSTNGIISFIENGVLNQVSAQTVLVTASLGVLKAGNIKFTPSLPDWKQDAIDGKGFGVLNKCIMYWNGNDMDNLAWPGDTLWFELITPDDLSSGKWTTFFNPTKYKGVPTLEGFIGGNEAIDIETQTDEEILDDVMKNLVAMFPSITRPDRVIITRWGQEENIKGSYSFQTVGRDRYEDANSIKETIGNLWFAGEATDGTWYGTATGAWESGEDAALSMASVLER